LETVALRGLQEEEKGGSGPEMSAGVTGWEGKVTKGRKMRKTRTHEEERFWVAV